MACQMLQQAHPLFQQLRIDLLKSETMMRVVGQVLLGCARKYPGEKGKESELEYVRNALVPSWSCSLPLPTEN